MATRAMTGTEDPEIEQTVRQVLGEVLNEVSDELSSPGEPPTDGRTSRASARGAGRGNPTRPSPGVPDGGEALPPEVSDAMEAVIRDLTPKQAQTLASLFDAIGDQEEGEEEEEEERPGMIAGAGAGAELELGSMREARTQGEAIARRGWKPVADLLKKSYRLYKASVRAAKGGRGSFNRWVNGLSNWNPVKWAIKALPSAAYIALQEWLAQQSERGIAARRTTAAAGEVEPEEIEQVVRRVLSEALTEQEGLRAH